MNWAAFYETEVFTGDPWDAPERGIVCIAQMTDGNVEVLTGDFFAFHSGRWWNHDYAGLMDHLTEDARKVDVVRVGRYVRVKDYNRIFLQAHAWRPS